MCSSLVALLTAPQLCGALGFTKHGGRLYLQFGPLIEESGFDFLYNSDWNMRQLRALPLPRP